MGVLEFIDFFFQTLDANNFEIIMVSLHNLRISKEGDMKMDSVINLTDIFNLGNVIIYFIAINLIAFFTMWIDKRKAKNRFMEN